MQAIKAGLEDVVVSDSAISTVDGERGILIYRGYDVRDLVQNCSFEEIAHLLWYGYLPNRAELRDTTRKLAAHRLLSAELYHLIEGFPRSAPPMAVLRTAVSAIGLFDPRAESDARETNLEMAIELTGQTATIVAVFNRMRQHLPTISPDPRLSFAADFLHMATGRRPDPASEKAFDNALSLHMDHEFNASTFAARVTASTLSDIYSAAVSAIGALRGPLHGGANQQVMHMLLEIGTPDRAEAYVNTIFDHKDKVMGFGHRVYKTEDPRANILKNWCKQLCEERGEPWYEIQDIIEKTVMERKVLYPNVDFYSAPVYHMLGIPTDLFTPIFAISRMVGWTAHILEQYQNNRLIRPRAEYTGPIDLRVKPISER